MVFYFHCAHVYAYSNGYHYGCACRSGMMVLLLSLISVHGIQKPLQVFSFSACFQSIKDMKLVGRESLLVK